MQEDFIPENLTQRQENIKAWATFDAHAYVKLMKKKSSSSLIDRDSNGKLILNSADGRKIFSNTQRTLNLTQEEMAYFALILIEEVEKIVSDKNKKITDK